MLFVAEMIAFLQLTVVPGLLLMALLRPGLGKFRSFLLLPGLSLPVNYIFVSLAFRGGFFIPAVSWAYTAAVWLATAVIWRREIVAFFNTSPAAALANARDNIITAIREMSVERRNLLTIILIGAVIGIFYNCRWLWNAVDGVFVNWDSALSWNFWAESWSRGEFPARLSYYPQLLPKNWALVYQLTGSTVCFVPKASVSVFPLLIMLMFWARGIGKRNAVLLLTIPVLTVYFHNVDYLAHGGELDLLMAYYGAAVFFLTGYAKDAENNRGFCRCLILGVLFAAAAGVTKQAGLYLIAAFAVLAAVDLRREIIRRRISGRKQLIFLLAAVILLTALVLPHYIVAHHRISNGMDSSNTQLVTHTIYGGKSLAERFICSIRLFTLRMQCGLPGIASARHAAFELSPYPLAALWKLYNFQLLIGVVMIVLNLFLLYLAFKDRRMWGAGMAALPFFLIWSMFFCYDLRNLSLMLPLLALLTAAGAWEMVKSLPAEWFEKLKLRHWIAVAAVVFAVMYPLTFSNGWRVHKFVLRKLSGIGDPHVNRGVMEYYEEFIAERKAAGLPKKSPVILTDYEYIKLLEPYRENWKNADFSLHSDAVLQVYRQAVDDPEITAVLLPRYASETIRKDILARVENGKMRQRFTALEYSLYEKL